MTGRILSPLEEFANIKQFVSVSWKGSPLPLMIAPAPGVPFSESELVTALRSLTRALALLLVFLVMRPLLPIDCLSV